MVEDEDETYTIEGPDGNASTVALPAGLADVFSEDDESPTDVLAAFVVQTFAQQTHAAVHHSEGDAPEDLVAMNDRMEELFEERFGVSLTEAMGHGH
ncbi:MAG: hypothetical protein ABEJ81_07685 [Haloferacaceae archaeon]